MDGQGRLLPGARQARRRAALQEKARDVDVNAAAGEAMRRIAATALAVLAIFPVAVGAQPARASSVVKIDFRALTDEGQQVGDLKPDEITLKVNGKPRQLQWLGVFRSAASDAPRGSSLPPPYATNAVGTSGRVIHVLIDDDSITPGREGQVRE